MHGGSGAAPLRFLPAQVLNEGRICSRTLYDPQQRRHSGSHDVGVVAG